MGEILRTQDYLFTVIVRDADAEQARVIGPIINFLHAPQNPEAVIERMASPDTKIVSLTVTEAGYCENKATGQLNETHPSIVHDVQSPGHPIGTYGFIAEALRRRRARALPPFTVMSCDNLLNNGTVCRRMMLAFPVDATPLRRLGRLAAMHPGRERRVVRILPRRRPRDAHALLREHDAGLTADRPALLPRSIGRLTS